MSKNSKVAGKKKTLVGTVKSNKMDSTVRVVVETPFKHPVYRKVVSKRKTYFARTNIELEIGDRVVIQEHKPFSKNVRWLVIEKVD